MRIRACLLLILPLAACASKPNYAFWRPHIYTKTVAAEAVYEQANPPVIPPYVADKVDGSYQGTAYLTSAGKLDRRHWWRKSQVADDVCPATRYGIVEIGDHVLYYSYTPDLAFTVPVDHQGAFSQTIGAATLHGKVRGGRLTFNVISPLCTTRFFGDYKLNHS